MERYINAEKIKYHKLSVCEGHGLNFEYTVAYKHEVDAIPTADVVPSSEVEKLELTLQGVMWSVDKWLDETDYDADPIKRAITMREKTLKIVETLKAEVAREIFAEIEKYDRRPVPECKPVYTLRQRDFEELKKKYTEGAQDV